jgi:uncharacterized protein YecE (DUF72 family)
LHGRRYDTWFAHARPHHAAGSAQTVKAAARGDFFPQNAGVPIPAFERYNYLYSQEELLPWAERIHAVSAHASSTYVVTNNHYLGKGVVNALQLISILKGVKINVPESLREPYPQLNEIAVQPPEAPTLFRLT